MTETPTTTITAPHPSRTKDPQLDQDRFIPLCVEVADAFANAMNVKFSTPEAARLLKDGREQRLAQIVSNEPLFPFTACVDAGHVKLSPALHKMAAPVLKDISDGVTEINKRFAATTAAGESAKFALAMLFQPAMYEAYFAAGMTEGSHTRYTERSC